MKYVRIYSDSAGKSHFADCEIELTPANFAPPAPPLNLSAFLPTKRLAFVNLAVDWYGDWHPTPSRQFMIVMNGETAVEVSDGEIRHFVSGSVLLLEDVSGQGHRTRVVGKKGEVFITIVQLGE